MEKIVGELLRKIDKAIKSQFVGDVIFTEDELDTIFSQASSLLRNYDYGYTNSISHLEDGLILVSMVNATKSWNAEEDNFWANIARIIIGTEELSSKVYQYLIKLIDRLGERKEFLHFNKGKRYYATLLAHAFAPIKSTESFFELCWRIYCDDLNFDFDENDNIYNMLALELAIRFGSDSDVEKDFELGSHVYALKAGIKRLATDCTDVMARFIKRTISTINSIFHSETLDSENYYENLIREWWYKKELTFGESPRPVGPGIRPVADYSKIKPKYVIENGKVCLTIPAIRLADNFYYNPYLEIYNGEKCVLNEELLTKGSGLTMATKTCTYDVEEILLEGNLDLRVNIIHCGKIIYGSKKTLVRSFLLFNDNREVFAQECEPGNYNLFAFDFDDNIMQYPENIRKKRANLYTFNASEGEILQSKQKSVLFTLEKQNREVWIYADNKSSVVFRSEGEEYSVIDGELKLATAKTINVSDYGVRYKDTSWKLSDFSVEEKGENLYYNISQLLSDGEPQKIAVFRYSTNKIICHANIVKFNNINVEFDKDIYYGKDTSGEIRFSTKNFSENVRFDISDERISIPIQDGELIFNAPIIRWRIDDGEWNSSYSERGIWYKNITNSSELELDVPNRFEYQVGVSVTNSELEQCRSNCNKYKLGQTIYALKDNESEIVIFAKIGATQPLPILRIHTEEKFINTPIVLSADKQLKWIAKENYIGGENDILTIVISSGNTEKLRRNLAQTECQIDVSQIEDGHYDVAVELQGGNIFLPKSKTLWKKNICIGDENKLRFKNKYLVIDEVMLDNQAVPTRIKIFCIDNLTFLQERDGSLFYSGNMFFINQYGKKVYLDKMENSCGEWETTNPVRIELRTNKTCWIVAGLENDLDSFLGELFWKQYQLSNVDKWSKSIHYYIFNTKENSNV